MEDQTFLRMAVEKGNCSLVKVLLRFGADVNSRVSSKCDPPLHLAVRLGNLEMVRTLLDHSAEVNGMNRCDLTPLHSAAAIGQVDMVELLLNRGANVYASSYTVIAPLHVKATYEPAEVIELLQSGMQKIYFYCEKNFPVDFAATFGHVKVVEILIDHCERLSAIGGHDASMKGFIKRTALERAIEFLHPDVVELLLKRDTSPFDNFHVGLGLYSHKFFKLKECCLTSHMLNDKPQMGLYARRHQRVLDVLFTSGLFNANTLNSRGKTPLLQICHQCSGCDYLKGRQNLIEKPKINHLGDIVAKMLLENGANVNQTDCYGNTALMHAAPLGCDHFVRLLLEFTKMRGIKLLLDARNQVGQTALSKAIEHRQTHVVMLLIENGASINVHDVRGFTALHEANYHKFNWFKSDYLYLSNERRKRKLDTSGTILKWFEKKFSSGEYRHNKMIRLEDAKREIIKIVLNCGEARETSLDFAGNTPRDLSVDTSETLEDQIPPPSKRSKSTIAISTNPSKKFVIDDWKRTPFHRLCKAFSSTKRYESYKTEVIRKMKLSRMNEVTSAMQLRKEKRKTQASLTDCRGRTALHYPAMADYFRSERLSLLIEMLLKRGISINAVDNYGRTALHYASQDEIYNKLVEHGANERAVDNKGHTPVHLKELRERMEIKFPILRDISKCKESSDRVNSMNLQEYAYVNKQQRIIKRLDKVTKVFEHFMERIASAIGERDHRFTCKSQLVGSAADGTKIEIPGDFDFILTLTELSKRCEVHPSPVAPVGFVHLRRNCYYPENVFYKRKDDFDAFFNEEQFLLVHEANNRFKILLEEVLQDPQFWVNDDNLELCNFEMNDDNRSHMHRRIELQMIHPFPDEEGDLYFNRFNFDIVPCIHLDNWWPDEAIAEVNDEVKSFGCNLVFASPEVSYPWVPFDDTYARISFALAESHIIKNTSCLLKAAFSIARVVCFNGFRDLDMDSEPKNWKYVLKSSFLYCIEAFGAITILQEPLELSLNSAKKLIFLVNRIMLCFAEFCDQDFLPSYFMPSDSLPIHRQLKSNHIECFVIGETEQSFCSEARKLYKGLFAGYLKTQCETENFEDSETHSISDSSDNSEAHSDSDNSDNSEAHSDSDNSDNSESNSDSDSSDNSEAHSDMDESTDSEKHSNRPNPDDQGILKADFSNSAIQPLFERFDRKTFMTNIFKCKPGMHANEFDQRLIHEHKFLNGSLCMLAFCYLTENV